MLPTFIRDTREKDGFGFSWNKTKECSGTIEKALSTGDYSIEGYEDQFVVERKGSASEILNNLFSPDKKRFYEELNRLKDFKAAWIICEFSLQDVADEIKKIQRFTRGKFSFSGITMDKFLGAIASIYAQYNVPILFTGAAFKKFNTKTNTSLNVNYAKDLTKKLLLKAVKYKGAVNVEKS